MVTQTLYELKHLRSVSRFTRCLMGISMCRRQDHIHIRRLLGGEQHCMVIPLGRIPEDAWWTSECPLTLDDWSIVAEVHAAST